MSFLHDTVYLLYNKKKKTYKQCKFILNAISHTFRLCIYKFATNMIKFAKVRMFYKSTILKPVNFRKLRIFLKGALCYHFSVKNVFMEPECEINLA